MSYKRGNVNPETVIEFKSEGPLKPFCKKK